MTYERILSAEREAKRFISRVEEFKNEAKRLADIDKTSTSISPMCWSTPKQSGAVRRASLDLTRSLAEMRRPQ